ncbi:MAG: hypothetical protein LBK06_10955 [Planctomycetaceae bacterium]|jgi:hypothetical protein|nr:hypothetical protein [Planctomycetaceae bacterium]
MPKLFVNIIGEIDFYTEAGNAIGFALEQPLHVVALPCSALRILKRLQHSNRSRKIVFHDDLQIGTAR